MATFKEALTIEGRNLVARALSGDATITFTKIVMGDGEISQSALATVKDVVNPKKEIDIYSVIRDANNSITVTGLFSNDGIESGFYFREKGVYATDGTTEILMLYGNNGDLAEWINPIGSSVIQKKLSTILTFSETDNIRVTLQNGIYASHEDMMQIVEEIHNINLDGDWAKYTQAEAIQNAINEMRTYYTNNRGVKIDNLDESVSSRASASVVGNTADTGGSSVAGTVMAKLNAILAQESTATQAQTIINLINAMRAYYTDGRGALLDRLEYLDTYSSGLSGKLDTVLSKMGAGDYAGKDIEIIPYTYFRNGNSYSYTNSKGGWARIQMTPLQGNQSKTKLSINIDGVVKTLKLQDLLIYAAENAGSATYDYYEIIVPFKSYFIFSNIETEIVQMSIHGMVFLNK